MSFVLGQRVIVVKGFPPYEANDVPEVPEKFNILGYYGHVVGIQTPSDIAVFKKTLYWVHFNGRVGCEAARWFIDDPLFNPFSFWENQLEAAD